MQVKKIFSALLLAVLPPIVAACAPAAVTLSREDLAQLKSQAEVGAVRHEPALFYADAGVYGLAGYGMSISAGKELRKKYAIEDPAPAVQAKFLESLAAEFKGVAVRSLDRTAAADDLGAVRSAYPGRWLFDFKTIGWGSAAEGDVEFTVRARLIRGDDAKIAWEGACNYATHDARGELLTLKNAALLKKKLQAGVTPCARELWSRFLSGASSS